ncbi:MAG: gamma-glutamylcyclotransferase [Candidatus Pelagibacter sp.]|nr:gamma-glutamylcyclotransferase [Candidatus Pelagibacter sp.]
MKMLIWFSLILFIAFEQKIRANECNQIPKKGSKNYVIGYGSLMEKESRIRTNKKAKKVKPLIIKNFKREWGQRSEFYKITFLTLSEHAGSQLNAVYYPLSIKEIKKLDQREKGYCRVLVKKKNISFYERRSNLTGKNFWVYSASKNNVKYPDNKHPIVQSYVDIFLNGCFQIQDKFKIKEYAKTCITTTKGWSKNWINDRLYARRPFKTPNSYRIDKLLKQNFTYYLDNKIE